MLVTIAKATIIAAIWFLLPAGVIYFNLIIQNSKPDIIGAASVVFRALCFAIIWFGSTALVVMW